MEKVDKSFIKTLEKRFLENMDRHKTIKWDFVRSSILNNPDLYDAIFYMEETGGEPDLVDLEAFKGLVYVDLSHESPKKRRSFSYDKKARQARKENSAKSSVEEEVEKNNLELLDEEKYQALAKIAEIDNKSTSWIVTPSDIRDKNGALYMTCRFGRTFTYFNTPGSYYRDRGFRAYVKI